MTITTGQRNLCLSMLSVHDVTLLLPSAVHVRVGSARIFVSPKISCRIVPSAVTRDPWDGDDRKVPITLIFGLSLFALGKPLPRRKS